VIDEDVLFAEIAWVGRRVGWSLAEILDLEHPLRRRLIEELHALDEPDSR
jgi:hypothetical protein